MTQKLKVNWDELGSEAISILREFAGDVVEGAKDDIDDFWADGAVLLQTALMIGDYESVRRVKDALRVVAERNRLRIVNEKWVAFERTIELANRIASVALGNVLSII